VDGSETRQGRPGGSESGAPARDEANPAAKPVRRSFTAAYRARVLAEYEAAPQGEKSAVLRREGLYQSQVAEWAAARDALAAGQEYSRQTHRASANSTKKNAEADRLRRENDRLKRELATSQAVVEIMGKRAPRARRGALVG
jgi:transposase-like protein